MNKLIMMGRLTKDAEIRYGGANNTAVASFSIAVERRFKRDGEPDADFFDCSAFGRTAEFIEKYIRKGTKVLIEGELRNDNYQKDGKMVYRNKINVSNIEFAESKSSEATPTPAPSNDGFMNIPDGIEEELPFK